MDKRCGNCGRYPFCNDMVNEVGVCGAWIKQEMKEIKKIVIKEEDKR